MLNNYLKKYKKLTLIFFNVCIIFFFNNVYSASPATTLTQLLTAIHTLRADFTQTIKDKNAKILQQSQGAMILQRPGKFRWEIKKPIPQLIVVNGQQLWIYDPDLDQLTTRSVTKEAGQAPAMLLTEATTALAEDFRIQFGKNNAKNSQWFILIPKDKESLFAVIKLTFINNQIRKMELQDHLGHTTEIQFYHVQMNPLLPTDLFGFKPVKSSLSKQS